MSRVTEMFAFVVADRGPSDEGIPAIDMGGVPYPMVGADIQRCESFYGVAEDLSREIGRRVELRSWTNDVYRVVTAWGEDPSQCPSIRGHGAIAVECDLFDGHDGEHEWHAHNIYPGKEPMLTWA
jgi:hypothetical protein